MRGCIRAGSDLGDLIGHFKLNDAGMPQSPSGQGELVLLADPGTALYVLRPRSFTGPLEHRAQ